MLKTTNGTDYIEGDPREEIQAHLFDAHRALGRAMELSKGMDQNAKITAAYRSTYLVRDEILRAIVKDARQADPEDAEEETNVYFEVFEGRNSTIPAESYNRREDAISHAGRFIEGRVIMVDRTGPIARRGHPYRPRNDLSVMTRRAERGASRGRPARSGRSG